MPRQRRYRIPCIPQHVIARGNDRKACFFEPADYRSYLKLLHEASAKHDCGVHAYVLMTNHVHLLVTPQAPDSVSRTLQAVGRRYVQQVNVLYRRTGTLWEGRFKATVVSREDYLLRCYRYIELNPVRAGMVAEPGDYPWSSYGHNALGGEDRLVSGHETYLSLRQTARARQAAYRELFRESMSEEELEQMRCSTQMGWPLVNDRFKAEIEAMYQRRIPRHKWGGARSGSGRKPSSPD